MHTDKDKAQFEQWQKRWDMASEQFAKEYAAELSKKNAENSQPETSWLTNTPMDRNYQEPELEGDPSWRDIYDRSQNIDGLLTEDSEVKYEVEPKPKANYGAFSPTKTNPTRQDTTGPDVGPSSGGVRVTPNWSDGPDLRELDDIKRKIEAMERKCHEDETRKEKPSSLRKQLESLRDRVTKLSEKINREPDVDVT